MKTVYLCGGINGLTDNQCRDWREKTTEALCGKAIVLDPMRRDYRGMESGRAKEIVEQDLADIDLSDIVLVNATSPSWGTAMEVFYASRSGKKVIAFGGSASPWLIYHAITVPNLETALALI